MLMFKCSDPSVASSSFYQSLLLQYHASFIIIVIMTMIIINITILILIILIHRASSTTHHDHRTCMSSRKRGISIATRVEGIPTIFQKQTKSDPWKRNMLCLYPMAPISKQQFDCIILHHPMPTSFNFKPLTTYFHKRPFQWKNQVTCIHKLEQRIMCAMCQGKLSFQHITWVRVSQHSMTKSSTSNEGDDHPVKRWECGGVFVAYLVNGSKVLRILKTHRITQKWSTNMRNGWRKHIWHIGANHQVFLRVLQCTHMTIYSYMMV